MENKKFIINPVAGNQDGPKLIPYIKNLYPDAEIVQTVSKMHAYELARQYANTNSLMYAVGGDGTLNEVLNGMMSTECNSVLATVPCGSGRDFARNFANVKDPRYFLKQDINIFPIDIGNLDYGYSDRYFINAVAAGITAEIGEIANYMNIDVSSSLKYILSVLPGIIDYKFPEFSVMIKKEIIKKRMTTIMISNGKYIGGGFIPAPEASLDDGLLDVIIMTEISKLSILPLAVRLYFGKHMSKLNYPPFKTEDISFNFYEPTIVNVDGETIIANKMKCKVHHKAINFCVPKGK